jgi:hypothetical protein
MPPGGAGRAGAGASAVAWRAMAASRSWWTRRITTSTLIPLATWWTSQTSVATQSSPARMAPLMPRWGTKAPSSAARMVRSSIRQ